MEKLIFSGAILIAVSLALAWLLVAVKYMGWFTGIFKNAKHLLSAHIDYLLMAVLNWLLYLLLLNRVGVVDERAVWCVIIGSFWNPFLFLVMSVKPEIRKSPFSPFGMFSSVSFIITTTGYLWAAGLAAHWI